MEEKHRKKIYDNLEKLVEKTEKFEDVFEILKTKKMFNEFMAKEITNKPKELKVKFFYQYVTTRGPNAFQDLLEALKKTDNLEAHDILFHSQSCKVIIEGHGFSGLSLEEEFPHDRPWIVAKTHERFDYNREEVYKMDSNPKGLLLIINNRTFVNDTLVERIGSEHDVARLKSIFEQLGYQIVIPKSDQLRASEIKSEVEKFSQMKEHKDCDSCVVVVMSHGKATSDPRNGSIDILGWDHQTVNTDDLINYFSARLCPGLSKKPKLFFFQACRGENFHYPVAMSGSSTVNETREVSTTLQDSVDEDILSVGNIQIDGQRVPPTKIVRNMADILIGYSTTPDHVSHRDETGSWYIQTLCRMIAKYAATKDIVFILQKVRMKEESFFQVLRNEEANEWVDFSTTRAIGVSKYLYFQPGVYQDIVPSQLSHS